MKIRCEFCNSEIESTEEFCKQCGAVNEKYARMAAEQPKSIPELERWYVEHNLPPYSVTRFFIGQDVSEAKCFGIYRDDQTGNFVVYKNKTDGTRAVRYSGKDEAYAVNELYQRLKDEVLNQKAHNINSGVNSSINSGSINNNNNNYNNNYSNNYTNNYTNNNYSTYGNSDNRSPKKKNSIPRFLKVLIIFWGVSFAIQFIMVILMFSMSGCTSLLGAFRGGSGVSGDYGGYYYSSNDSYSDDSYDYSGSNSDSYSSYDYSYDSGSDWDSGYSWDSGDSWDSGSSDWDSDW